MDDRRDLLIALGWRLLLAAPFVLVAVYLFTATRGDPDGGGQRLAGLVCIVGAGIVVARPLAGLIAEPTGSLFYPRRVARPAPRYSVADTRRKQGRFAEALREYESISEQFPAEVRPYLVMMDIAYVNLHDGERGDAIVKRARHRAIIACPIRAWYL